MQYRRLTAHLQTGSADFNRRLSAYLTNHVAMRSALDQAITNSYAQQYPNAPQFAHNQQMYPSPFMHQAMPQQHSPQSYVQSPYTMPPTPTYPQPQHAPQHARSQSTTAGPEMPRYAHSVPTSSPVQVISPVVERRRTSAPTKSVSPPGSTQRTPQPVQARPATQQSQSAYNTSQERKPPSSMQAPPHPQTRPQSAHQPTTPTSYSGYGPLTTSLPAESQQLLGSALDPHDPFTAALMAGADGMAQPFYHPTPNKHRNFYPSHDGMSATLAPSALDMTPPHGLPMSMAASGSWSAPPYQTSFDPSAFDFSKGQMYGSGTSSSGSGAATPGFDGNLEAFINDSVNWAEATT